MFRFKQRLSTILGLGDKPLTPDQVSGLDHYDLELEDALSANTGDPLWSFGVVGGNPTLYNNRSETAGITDVAISPDSPSTAPITLLYMSNPGTTGPGDVVAVLGTYASGGATSLFADGLVTVQSVNGDISLEALAGNVTITPKTGGFLTLANLPILNPGGSGRVWNDAGTLKIT